MDIFDLSATLSLDTSQYEQGLSGAKAKGEGWTGAIAGGFKKAAVGVAAVTTAVAAVGAGFAKAAVKTSEYGDKVDKMSQKIGISAEAYQKWDYVMQRAGGSIDSMKMGMKTLSKQAESNSDAFQKLGISQEEVASLSQEDLFERTVKGLAGMEQGTERAALASELLGRAGADMGPLLNGGTEAIEEQMEIAEKYGMVMPDAAVKASAAFQDSLTTMNMTFEGLKNRMMAEFLPAMTQVTDGMAKLFAGDMSGADDVAAGIEAFIDKLGQVLPVVMEIGGRIMGNLAQSFIDKLPELLSATATVVGNVLTKLGELVLKVPEIFGAMDLGSGITNAINQIFEALPGMLESFGEIISQLADWMVENAPSIIMALVTGIVNAIPSVISAAGQIVNAILKVIVGLPMRLVAVALSAVGNFALGLLKGLNKVTTNAGKIVSSVISAVKSLPGKLAEQAGSAVSSFAKGISNGVSSAVKQARELASKIVSGIKGGLTNMDDIGSNIVKGIGNGITNGVGWIKGQIKSFVGNVKSFLKNLFGIKSPSRWARDVIGANIDRGIAAGIQQDAGIVDDAIEELLPDYDKVTTKAVEGSATPGSLGNKTVNISNNIVVDGAEAPEDYAARFVRELKAEMRTA